MPKISPLAVVDPQAELADDVEVGPFCVIGPNVVVGAGTRLHNHVTLTGHTTIGRGNEIHANAVLGGGPQDRKYRGEPTRLEVGDGNIIREAVTMHTGTVLGGGLTRIGSHGLFMVNVHLGHDVHVGDHVIMANNTMIAGHVLVGNYVNIMGAVGIHHFVTIGEVAFIAGMSRIHHDVPPFVKVDGADLVRGVNDVGLKRAGYTDDDVEALDDACRRLFFREKPMTRTMAEFNMQNGLNPQVRRMIEFLQQRDMGRHGRYQESMRTKHG